TQRRSSSITSAPSASAVRSTCLASTSTPASSCSRSLPSWKLTSAPTAAVMRVTAGESAALQTQRAVAWAKAAPTNRAMIVGALQSQRAEHAHEGLGPSVYVPCRLPAGTGQLRSGVVAGVGTQPLLQGSGGEPQGLAACRHLHRLQIQILDCRPA